MHTPGLDLACDEVVNCAGLGAQPLAANVAALLSESIPPAYYAKGNYFGLCNTASPFQRLIYPVPEAAGLGIHATIDLAGRCRFGPECAPACHDL